MIQRRKIVDFKRMITSTLPEGGAIGVSVPIGYDDVQVVTLTSYMNIYHALHVDRRLKVGRCCKHLLLMIYTAQLDFLL